MPLIYGVFFFFISWMSFTTEPIFKNDWFGDALSLSKTELIIASLLFLVGVQLGVLHSAVSRLERLHNSLAQRVYDRNDRDST